MPLKSGGVFAVARGIFDHPFFKDEPFTEREAWLWLCGQAAWKATRVRVGKALVDLKRGQCAYSTRFLAGRWKWKEPRVRRFLSRLKTDAMIVADTDAHATRITICNYNEFQKVSLPRDAATDAASDAQTTQQRRKEESIEYREEDILSGTGVPDPDQKKGSRTRYPADFDAAWLAYPRTQNMSKAEALPEWRKLSAEDRTAVLQSIPAYRQFLKTKPDLETIHFVRYLKKRRFDGFVEAGSSTATDDDWLKKLQFGREKREWATGEWGPAPGQPACQIPAHLLQPGDGVGWSEWKRPTTTN